MFPEMVSYRDPTTGGLTEAPYYEDAMQTVYDNGALEENYVTFEQLRAEAAKYL